MGRRSRYVYVVLGVDLGVVGLLRFAHLRLLLPCCYYNDAAVLFPSATCPPNKIITPIWGYASLAPSLLIMGFAAVPHSIPSRRNRSTRLLRSTASKSAESTLSLHKRQLASMRCSRARVLVVVRVRVAVGWYVLVR